MRLAKVLGTVVTTVCYDGLEGMRFLILQPLDRHQRPNGQPVVAADAIHTAGTDDLVFYVASREAAVAMPDSFVPVDHAVVGLVDAVTLTDEDLTDEDLTDGTPKAGEMP